MFQLTIHVNKQQVGEGSEVVNEQSYAYVFGCSLERLRSFNLFPLDFSSIKESADKDNSRMLKDIHFGLPTPVSKSTLLVNGSYDYYHYICDEVNDVGWGCGYRTLQTLCSWIKYQLEKRGTMDCHKVPSILEIQKTLVEIGDKNESFIGSKQWIGSVEVAFCVDHLYKVESKILHFRNTEYFNQHVNDIWEHFELYGSPIMMGGDRDCSSKAILGISRSESSTELLILDPHFHGPKESRDELQIDGWIQWKNVNSLDESSFYNLCCPLLHSNK